MTDSLFSIPSRESLTQPLLVALNDHGPLSPQAAADAVAEQLGLEQGLRDLTMPIRDGGRIREENVLRYRLRWVRHNLVADGLLDGALRGLWQFSTKGKEFYVRAQPGVIISVFETNLGTALCAEANTVLQAIIDRSIQTYVTSPVYPILSARPYGGLTPVETVAFVAGHLQGLQPKLTADGNVFLNLGYVHNEDGSQSSYVERLLVALEDQGYKLLQRLFWYNPSKPPAGRHVTHRRTHFVEKVEMIYRLALTSKARGDTRLILNPYGERMRQHIAAGGDKAGRRPSGHGHNGTSFARDNGGAIPGNLLRVPHESSHSPAAKELARRGLPTHPAPMPEALVDPLIRFTTSPGETVGDLMSGGGTVARVAEALNRRWISNDVHLNYASNSSVHFNSAPGFNCLVDPNALQDAFCRS